MPKPYTVGRRRVNISQRGDLLVDTNASIGIGSLIVFIAMITVAGVAASVMIQTMNGLEEQALKTASDTIRSVANGVRVTQVSGYSTTSDITKLAVFVETTAGSGAIDLSNSYLTISDSSTSAVLRYDSTCYSSTVSSGLFGTLDFSNISNSEFGVIIIRDIDSSCTSSTPTINDDDLAVLMVNTTACFSGIGTRTEVTGRVTPEYGMRGIIGFTTPTSFTKTIVELQP